MNKKSKKPKSVVKSISLREDIFDYAEGIAERMYGGNLSMFITNLICGHREGVDLLMVSKSNYTTVSNNSDNEKIEEEVVVEEDWRDGIDLDDDDMDWIDLTTKTGVSRLDDEDFEEEL